MQLYVGGKAYVPLLGMTVLRDHGFRYTRILYLHILCITALLIARDLINVGRLLQLLTYLCRCNAIIGPISIDAPFCNVSWMIAVYEAPRTPLNP